MSLIKLPPYDKARLLRFFAEESMLERNPYASHSRFFYRPPIGEALMNRMKPTVEVLVGRSLYTCSSFIRQHDHGSELRAHYDRRGMEYTVSVTVEQDFEDWCLETFEDEQWVPNHTQDGWGAFMNGTYTAHRRAPYPGQRAIIMTLSYTTNPEFAGDNAGSQLPHHILVRGVLEGWQVSRVYREWGGKEFSVGWLSKDDRPADQKMNLVSYFEEGKWAWLYERMEQVMRRVNSMSWNLDVSQRTDPLQFTRYGEDNEYPWHIDNAPTSPRIAGRTLSASLLLKNPKGGGGLEIMGDGIIDCEPGDMVIFPSSQLHRALPVLRGTRDSLVMWLSKGAD